MAHLTSRMRVNARFLRHNETRAEHKIWWMLRGGRLGVKFRRQVPFGPYILDFYCVELKLCVELDGAKHETLDMGEYDDQRTSYLSAQGIEVLRIANELTDSDDAIEVIKARVARLAAG